MLRKLKQQWHDIRRGKPGKRFQVRYEHRQRERCGIVAKALYTIVGTALLLAGLLLLPAPGPGIIVVLIGAAMVGQESLWAARALDRTELALRAAASAALRAWDRASTALRAVAVGLGAALAAAAGWAAWAVLSG